MKCHKLMVVALVAGMVPFNLMAVNSNDQRLAQAHMAQTLALNAAPKAGLQNVSLLLPADFAGIASRKPHDADADRAKSAAAAAHVNTNADKPVPASVQATDVVDDNHGLALLAALGLVVVQLRRKHKSLQLRSLSGRYGLYA